MTIDISRAIVFMLVMLRMTGMLVLNPIFGRSNIPTLMNTAFAFIMTVLITTTRTFPDIPDPTLFEFFYLALKELMIGLCASMILRLFLSVMIMAGEIIDMQLGIGMAKAFDPGTNASLSLSATVFNAMFVLAFFTTNNHLTFIHMTEQTFDIIPLGMVSINMDMLGYIPDLFASILIFSMKLCLPIVVIEIIVTVAVGIIMRIIPQINVFVVNIQFKLLIGLFSMVVLMGPFMAYFENLIIISFERIQYFWMNLT